MAIGAMWSLDRQERRAVRMAIRHVMHPCVDQAGAQYSQSPMDAEGGAVMDYFRTSANRRSGQNCSHREIINKTNQDTPRFKLGHRGSKDGQYRAAGLQNLHSGQPFHTNSVMIRVSEKDRYQIAPIEAALYCAPRSDHRGFNMTAAQALRSLVLAVQVKPLHDNHIHSAFRARTPNRKCRHDRSR
jgi:hypothetical protein